MRNDHKNDDSDQILKLYPRNKGTPSATVELLNFSVYHFVMITGLVWDATYDDATAN